MTGPAPHWTLHVEDSLLRAELHGAFGLLDLLRFLQAVPATRGFRPSMNALVDVRGARSALGFADSVRLRRAFETYLVRRGAHFRAAFVVDGRDGDEVVDMVRALVKDLPLQVVTFSSMDEAMAWVLGPGPGEGPDEDDPDDDGA